MEPPIVDSPSRRGRADTVFVAVALALFVAVTGWTSWHHEPYADEADAWLIARDASVAEVFGLTGHGGSPALLHLVHMPLAKLGFPYGAMRAVHLAIVWAAATTLLCCAPWPRSTRALVAFSYFVLCEYAVVVRSYGITLLLLFAAAALWRRRFERPLVFAALVALLANANVLSLFIAAALGALYLWDLLRRRRAARTPLAAWLAAAIMLVAGVASVLQLVPHGPTQFPGFLTLRNPHAPEMVLALLFAAPSWLAAVVGDLRWLALGTLAACVAAWLARPRLLFLFLLPAAGMMYTFVFKWIAGVRHAGLVFLLLLFVLWVGRLEPAAVPAWSRAASRLGRGLLHVGLAVLVASAVEFVRLELRHPYSHAEQMGAYLAASGLAARPLATTVRCEGVVPYLPARAVFYADQGRWGTYRTWDAADVAAHDRPLERTAAAARRALPRAGGWLLLLHAPLPAPERLGLRPLAASQGPTGPSGERFYLYAALPES